MGSLPDTTMAQFVLTDTCIALEEKGADAKKLSEAYLAVSESARVVGAIPSPVRY
jgi:hypothetical protein